jgi:hypothetical protein
MEKTDQDIRSDEDLAYCNKLCRAGIKLLVSNLAKEGIDRDKLIRALKKTEIELESIVSEINEDCRKSKHSETEDLVNKKKRKDYLTRILVHYLKETGASEDAVYFPRKSYKIFADAIEKLLGENTIREKQLECYTIAKDYQAKDGHIDWENIFVDGRTKQLSWDVFFRISKAMAGLSGNWFKEYIIDYAKTHGGFYGEGVASYVEERLQGIARMFKAFR